MAMNTVPGGRPSWGWASIRAGPQRSVGRCVSVPGGATFQQPALVLAETAPHAVVDAVAEGPLQTFRLNIAALAHLLSVRKVGLGRPSRADREEQLRLMAEARGAVAPVSGCHRAPHPSSSAAIRAS